VKAPLDGETGGSITLWTHRLPDGLLAIDSDMQLKSPIEVRTSFSGIFEQGKPKQILLFTSGDAEYSIFEVANQLQLEILPQWHKDV
ncbi:hypothetical protein KAR91_38530, partial [Candidatus Pacearchaeota archaeon]|nr:hypothetical protein [Candidatus Pacearchaeota archaeon]